MKRIGNLMPRIIERQNLERAFCLAARGRRSHAGVLRYMGQFEKEIRRLCEGLADGGFPLGQAHRFLIRDPKTRIIHAAPFRQRVMHHAIMNVCGPLLERRAVFDTYACYKGRGQWAAIRRCERKARRHPYFLKFDIRRYFDSVDHAVLLSQLNHVFKDASLLRLLRRILGSFQLQPGKGLPIGSLISQHLANFYLEPLDRWLLGHGECQSMVRYMDDVLVWSQERSGLALLRNDLVSFLNRNLKLECKGQPFINRSCHGVTFLGNRVFPGYATMSRKRRLLVATKLAALSKDMESTTSVPTLYRQQQIQALLASTRQVCSYRFRRRLMKQLGNESARLEPGASRGQLEQQPEELPVSQSQQELGW